MSDSFVWQGGFVGRSEFNDLNCMLIRNGNCVNLILRIDALYQILWSPQLKQCMLLRFATIMMKLLWNPGDRFGKIA